MRVELKPCPFCEGPPVPFVKRGDYPYGEAPLMDDYGDCGLYVSAVVFCHECGCDGPTVNQMIYDADDYRAVEAEAVSLWQERDSRHRGLFDAGEVKSLNLYPREQGS